MPRNVIATSSVTIASLVVIATVARADLSQEMRMSMAADRQQEFIEAFATNVRDNKDQEVLSALDPAGIQGTSSEQVLGALKKDVFPFFAKFKKLNGYETITNAQAPDGRIGLWHYTYMEDSDGNAKPFQIAIVEASGELKVLGIEVGRCVKGRHPRIKPCK